MNYNRLINAERNNEVLVWNDEYPIEGRNYEINKIDYLSNREGGYEAAYIVYGGGYKACVNLSEIGIKQ